MIQLSFQPAFDVYHTMFRFLRLRQVLNDAEVLHYDQLRIVDFYLLFFSRLEAVRLEPRHKFIKKLAAKSPSRYRYEHQPDDRFVFGRMKEIQRAAIRTLVFDGYFDQQKFEHNILAKIEKIVPGDLQCRIEEANISDSAAMSALAVLLREYSLSGQQGLKHRSGLLEYRYDAS